MLRPSRPSKQRDPSRQRVASLVRGGPVPAARVARRFRLGHRRRYGVVVRPGRAPRQGGRGPPPTRVWCRGPDGTTGGPGQRGRGECFGRGVVEPSRQPVTVCGSGPLKTDLSHFLPGPSFPSKSTVILSEAVQTLLTDRASTAK